MGHILCNFTKFDRNRKVLAECGKGVAVIFPYTFFSMRLNLWASRVDDHTVPLSTIIIVPITLSVRMKIYLSIA